MHGSSFQYGGCLVWLLLTEALQPPERVLALQLALAGGLSHPLLWGPLLSLFRMVEQPLELFLQRLSALTPEVSFLLAIVTMVVSLFSVICHPDGGRIDLGVEGQLHIISVLWGIVVINVRRDVVLFSFNFHGRIHLCSMDGNVGTIVVLLAVACLVLMTIIRPPLVWICVVSSVRGLARRWGVCLSVLRPSAPTVLSFILFTLSHGDE